MMWRAAAASLLLLLLLVGCSTVAVAVPVVDQSSGDVDKASASSIVTDQELLSEGREGRHGAEVTSMHSLLDSILARLNKSYHSKLSAWNKRMEGAKAESSKASSQERLLRQQYRKAKASRCGVERGKGA